MPQVTKARYWWAVLYPENMVDNWENKIDDLVQCPYAYCVHTMDKDSKSEHRKDHVHLILAFSNTTTYKHALNIFKLLGEKAVNTCKACVNIRHCYDYLIHDTDSCRKQDKMQYPETARITGNNFDIGAYEQVGTVEKDEMLQEMFDFAVSKKVFDVATFYIEFEKIRDPQYFSIFKSYTGAIERLCKGNYKRALMEGSVFQQSVTEDEQHVQHCPNCGSVNIKKYGKTASYRQRYRCNDCGKTFV